MVSNDFRVPDDFDADDMTPDARAAFLVYLATTGERAGQRSYVQTAELTGHPIGTIKGWGGRFRWGPRARAIDRSRSAVLLEAALEAAATQRVHNVAWLIKLRENEEAPWGERRRAVEMLVGMGGMGNVPPAQLPDDGDADTGSVDPVELARLAASSDPDDRATLHRLALGLPPLPRTT